MKLILKADMGVQGHGNWRSPVSPGVCGTCSVVAKIDDQVALSSLCESRLTRIYSMSVTSKSVGHYHDKCQ